MGNRRILKSYAIESSEISFWSRLIPMRLKLLESEAFMVGVFASRINLCRVYKMDWLRTKTIKAKTRQKNVKENGVVVLKQLIECCDGKCNPVKNYSYSQIIKATNNFCQSNCASRIDVYYRCYKGMLDDRPVLIQKGKYTLDMKEICRDIAISSMVSGHKNFLKLLGCCLEFTPPVLVFEFAEIITLGPLLATQMVNLRRIKIAREVANALVYVIALLLADFLFCLGQLYFLTLFLGC